MDLQKQNALIVDAERVSSWLEVDFTISIFGHEILHWHYPPQAQKKKVD